MARKAQSKDEHALAVFENMDRHGDELGHFDRARLTAARNKAVADAQPAPVKLAPGQMSPDELRAYRAALQWAQLPTSVPFHEAPPSVQTSTINNRLVHLEGRGSIEIERASVALLALMVAHSERTHRSDQLRARSKRAQAERKERDSK